MKPRIFIGSSSEAKPVANAIHSVLQRDAECTVWTDGVFGLSGSIVEDLMKQVHTSDFGIFVFSPDDVTLMRAKLFSVGRDNVVYELGLFSGALGPKRCFFVTPDESQIHLPTDLLGITSGIYETRRQDRNMDAAVRPFCTKVTVKMKELGFRQLPGGPDNDPKGPTVQLAPQPSVPKSSLKASGRANRPLRSGTPEVGNPENRMELLDDIGKVWDELRISFHGNDLRLKLFCYSGETLRGPLASFFRDLTERRSPVNRLNIQLLARDYTRPFIIPCNEDLEEDEDYRKVVITRNRKVIEDFHADTHDISDLVELEVRLYPFEPLHKGIIVNSSIAYWAIYPIKRAQRIVNGTRKSLWDYDGPSSRYVKLRRDGPPAEAHMFESITKWFDVVWDKFGRLAS